MTKLQPGLYQIGNIRVSRTQRRTWSARTGSYVATIWELYDMVAVDAEGKPVSYGSFPLLSEAKTRATKLVAKD